MGTWLMSGVMFGTAVQALALWTPKETWIPVRTAYAVNPRPTTPPSFQALRKRQGSSSSSSEDTFLIGPDRTCGFISGLDGAGFACDGASDTCVLVPATSATSGFVGCCDDRDCGLRVTCLDYGQITWSGLCDNGCMVDTFTAKCTAPTEPFCNTVWFPGDIYDYYCNSLSISTPQLAFTTYDGETDGRVFITTVFSDTSSDSSETSSGSKLSTSRTASSSSTTITLFTSIFSTPVATPDSRTGGGGSTTPVGAIVGGVVGGVAVLGLIALGIVFILRRPGTSSPPTPRLTSPAPQGFNATDAHHSFYGPPQGDPAKHNSTALINTQPKAQPYGTPQPLSPVQPYPGPPVDVQGGHPQAAAWIMPVSAGEYNDQGNTPISPSTTVAAHHCYQLGVGAGQGQTVYEIGDGGHRGTINKVTHNGPGMRAL